MSQDQPNIEEILVTVEELLRKIAGKSAGGERYDALCGAFLLGVVGRELKFGERQDESQRHDLESLLGRPGSLHELYQQFSQQVRSGAMDRQWDAAFDFAFKQVVDKVSVTNPNYLDEMHRAAID